MSKRQKLNEDAVNILSLPRDIQIVMISKLDPESIVSMCQVNKEFNELCKDNQFWRKLFRYKYGPMNYDGFTNMRKLYLAYTAILSNYRIDMKSHENVHTEINFFFDDDGNMQNVESPWNIIIHSTDRHNLLEETNTIVLILTKISSIDFDINVTESVGNSIHESIFDDFLGQYAGIDEDVIQPDSVTILCYNRMKPDKLLRVVYEMILNGFSIQMKPDGKYLNCSICGETSTHVCSTCDKQFCSVECSIKSKSC